MIFSTRAQVEALRKQYPVGTRIRLLATDDPYTRAKPGDMATVTMIDEQNVRSPAIEIATLTRRHQRGRGLRMA